jgi:hypothetical protein
MKLMHQKAGHSQGQVKALTKALADFVGQLDRLEPGVTIEKFAFGSRSLDINYQSGAKRINIEKSLTWENRSHTERIKLLVLNSESANQIPIPKNVRFGAYDAIAESEKTGWVITLNPVTKSLLALEIDSLKVLYFPGNTLEPRNLAEIFRPLLHWLSILKGGFVLHAGGVTIGKKTLLIAGPGNSGKTTLTQLCLSKGYGFMGDNVIEVQFSNEGTVAYGVYCTFKLRPVAIKVDVLNTYPNQKDEESGKNIYFAANHSGNFFDIHPKNVIGILRLDRNGLKTITVDKKSHAAFNITPNTIGQFPFFEEETLKRTFGLLKMVPTYLAGLLNPAEAHSLVKELF